MSSDSDSVGSVNSNDSRRIQPSTFVVVHIEEDAESLRLNKSPLKSAVTDHFGEILKYQIAGGNAECIESVLVCGYACHLFVKNPSALEKLLDEVCALPNLNYFVFMIPYLWPKRNEMIRLIVRFIRKIAPHSIKIGSEVRLALIAVQGEKINFSIETMHESIERIYSFKGTRKMRTLAIFDMLTEEVLSIPTICSCLCNQEDPADSWFYAMIKSPHILELEIYHAQFDESRYRALEKKLAGKANKKRRRKRKRSDDGCKITQPLTKLVLTNVCADFPNPFSRLCKAVAASSSLQELRIEDCVFKLETLPEPEIDYVEDIMWEDFLGIVQRNNVLRSIHIDGITGTYGGIYERMNFPKGDNINNSLEQFLKILENDNKTLGDVLLGGLKKHSKEPRLVAIRELLCLNRMGLRPFMEVSGYLKKDDFADALVEAFLIQSDDDLSSRQPELVPCLFRMFQSNPILVEFMNAKQS